jgi:hypothetical protein
MRKTPTRLESSLLSLRSHPNDDRAPFGGSNKGRRYQRVPCLPCSVRRRWKIPLTMCYARPPGRRMLLASTEPAAFVSAILKQASPTSHAATVTFRRPLSKGERGKPPMIARSRDRNSGPSLTGIGVMCRTGHSRNSAAAARSHIAFVSLQLPRFMSRMPAPFVLADQFHRSGIEQTGV